MRTSFFAPESPTAETLIKDVRTLADDTLKVARQQVVDPTLEATRRARAYARDVAQQTRGRLSQQVADAERYAAEQYDQTTRWVVAHPLKSLGVALAIGIVISSILGLASKR